LSHSVYAQELCSSSSNSSSSSSCSNALWRAPSVDYTPSQLFSTAMRLQTRRASCAAALEVFMAPSQECNSVSSISNSTSSVLWELLVCVGTGDRPRFAAVGCREGCRAASWCLSPPRRGCVWGFVVLVCVGFGLRPGSGVCREAASAFG
jgi:hypothetical protein